MRSVLFKQQYNSNELNYISDQKCVSMSVSEINPENIELQSEKSTISKAVTIKHYGGGQTAHCLPNLLRRFYNLMLIFDVEE